MAGGFSGNSSSMERRRRLMSTEELAQSDLILSEFGVTLSAAVPELPSTTGSGQQMLGRLISRRLWKHTLIIVVLLAVLLVPALPLERISALFYGNPERQQATLRLVEGTAGILLLLSGQLSLLIFAVRSHSAIDFRGRYRAWSWLAVLLLLTAGVLITGISALLTDLVATLLEQIIGPLRAARHAVVLVPATAVTALVVSLIVADMRRCRASQLLFAVALLLAVTAFAGRTDRGAELVGTRQSAMLLLWASGLVFSSTLLHCRFVVHINNDPPVRVSRTKVVNNAATVPEPIEPASASASSLPKKSKAATEEIITPVAITPVAIAPDTAAKAEPIAERLPLPEASSSTPGESQDRRSRKKQKQRRAG